MKTNYLNLILCIVIAITSCDSKQKDKKEPTSIINEPTNEQELPQTAKIEKTTVPTVNIKENDKLISPVAIKVNSQGLWLASEGVLGFVELIDNNGNKLAKGILTTKENWMTNDPVIFNTELIFSATQCTTGTLIIHNDPGPGEGEEAGEKISFTIPVTL